MKQALGPVFQAFVLDTKSAAPLYQQLYHLLRDALLSGALPAGSRLPSTRSLAGDLGLSRNTVTAAFERLVDDGFVESRVGDGSYVSQVLARRWQAGRSPRGRQPRTSVAADGHRALSRRGSRIAASVLSPDASPPRAFAVGIPALDAFPLATWQRLLARRSRRLRSADLAHGPPAGDRRLRRLIATYLATARGVLCTEEQVLVLPSAQLGLDLAGRLLLDPGDPVWIEEPGYLGARGAFAAAGGRLIPVPVDGDGIRVEAGRELEEAARLAYVTPSHQFPLGESMSLERRLQLLAWAEASGAWILEDDYDSEYRYAGQSPQAMQGLDRGGRVLYLGTFSKVLFPALRLAYLVIPEHLAEAFHRARYLSDGHVPPLTQAVLADFIEAGHFMGHLRRMRSLYRRRRDVLLAELRKRFGDFFRFSSADTGMHVTARLARGDDRSIARRAAAEGIDLACLSRYYLAEPRAGIAFGYAHVPQAEIVRACETLESLLLG